jgi:hypothetical protein
MTQNSEILRIASQRACARCFRRGKREKQNGIRHEYGLVEAPDLALCHLAQLPGNPNGALGGANLTALSSRS